MNVTRHEYCIIHSWLRRKYGSATNCENPECQHKSEKFEYALIKGFQYEKNRDHFKMLCQVCHRNYDMTLEKRQLLASHPWTSDRKDKIRKSRLGKKASEETRKRMSISRSGEGNPMYGISITGEDHHWFGKNHKESSKNLIRLSRASLSIEDVQFIRSSAESGVKQRDLCKQFNLSPPQISRIVNRTRYASW